MKILGVFAHLDDAEIWAGGTLMKHAGRGDAVRTVSFGMPNDPRMEESISAHRILGVELITHPLALHVDDRIISELLSEEIGNFQPDIVLTHWYDDCHVDHRKLFELCHGSAIKPWIDLRTPKAMFCVDTYSSRGLRGEFSPTHYIDVSAVWNKKMAAIEQFRSQPFQMWKNMIALQNSLFGERVMTHFAEGFLQVPLQGKLSPLQYLP